MIEEINRIIRYILIIIIFNFGNRNFYQNYNGEKMNELRQYLYNDKYFCNNILIITEIILPGTLYEKCSYLFFPFVCKNNI